MTELNDSLQTSSEQRPNGLLVVCVLSWINIGISIISTLTQLFGGPMSAAEMREGKVELLSIKNEFKGEAGSMADQMFDQMIHITEVYNANHYSVYALTMLFLLIGAAGVYLMFSRKKLGFHLYIIYSLLSVLLIYFFISPADVPSFLTIWSLIVSAVFVLLYSRHLSWMK